MGAIILVAILFMAVALIGPLFIAGFVVSSELRSRRLAGVNRAAYLVTQNEREQLSDLLLAIRGLQTQELELEQRGDRWGLARRADNMFDARNPEARELNAQWESLRAERGRLARARLALENQLIGRVQHWVSVASDRTGARAAILAFAITFTWMTADRLAGVGNIDLGTLFFGNGSDAGGRLAASGVASLIAAIALWAGGQAFAAFGRRRGLGLDYVHLL